MKIFPIAIVLMICCFQFAANGQRKVGTIKDKDGNSYTVKEMPDSKTWMTDNLKINIPGSLCYENLDKNCETYGRLYSWEAAQSVCPLFGEGWRLPTNDDWAQLGKHFGGVRDDSEDGGKAAFQALMPGGSSGLNIVLGGCQEQSATSGFARLEAHGFYWTSTATDSTHAWMYNFGKNGKIMNRHGDGEKEQAISVRCVRD